MELPYTRAMVAAAVAGDLDSAPFQVEPFFGLNLPERCPGVPQEVLNPQETWHDPQAYAAKARELAERFRVSFARFASQVRPEVLAAGPRP
jgi:phosphoenolpyruvate carboxykinase (ATP)